MIKSELYKNVSVNRRIPRTSITCYIPTYLSISIYISTISTLPGLFRACIILAESSGLSSSISIPFVQYRAYTMQVPARLLTRPSPVNRTFRVLLGHACGRACIRVKSIQSGDDRRIIGLTLPFTKAFTVTSKF